MEIIIISIAVLALAGYWIYTMSRPDQKDNEAKSERPWPYGKAVPQGKIHVKPADVTPGKSADDRVEAPAPAVAQVTAENKAAAVAKIKKAPAKKTADKKPAVKKAPAKKKSI